MMPRPSAGPKAVSQRCPAVAGRPDHQYALGDVRGQPPILLRVFEETHHLFQLLTGFVHSDHVGESHNGIGLDVRLFAALADRHETTHAHPCPACRRSSGSGRTTGR